MKRAYIMTIVAAGLVMTMAMGFNSCSGVNFSTAQKASDAGNGGLCLPGSTASGCIDPVPPKLVNYDETFSVPNAYSKVDVFLILDNSGSMKADLAKLADKLDGLVQILDAGGIDWQMCYTFTDTGDNGLAQEWRKMSAGGSTSGAGFTVLKPTEANRVSVFNATMGDISDNGSGNEQGIVAVRNAVKNSLNASCFRGDAALTTVIISDEDERSCGGRCKDWQSSEVPTATQYRDAIEYRKQYRDLVATEDDPQTLMREVQSFVGERSYINHSITIKPGDTACYDIQDKSSPAFYGVHYSRLQAISGGVLGDICAASYADQLTAMGQRTAQTINSVSLKCAPIAAPEVSVTPALASGVSYSMTGNKLVFSAQVPTGTSVRVKYTCAE